MSPVPVSSSVCLCTPGIPTVDDGTFPKRAAHWTGSGMLIFASDPNLRLRAPFRFASEVEVGAGASRLGLTH